MIKVLQSTSELVNQPSIKKYDTMTQLSEEYNVATIFEALDVVARGSYNNHILRVKKEDNHKSLQSD